MKAAALPVEPLSLPERWRALTPRERLLLTVGGGAVLPSLLFMLLPSTQSAEPVEIAQAPLPAAAPAPPPLHVAPPPAASASGLLLRGVLASGAIIAFPAGGERVVPLGREFMPGLTLKAVGVRHAILAGPGGDVRIELGKAGATSLASTSSAATPPGAARDGAAVAQQRRETIDYRLGMQPVTHEGRAAYAIKPGAELPHLRRAGLQPGDVIVGVDGGAGFSEEQLMELSWTIANQPRTELELVRNGRRMKVALEAAPQ